MRRRTGLLFMVMFAVLMATACTVTSKNQYYWGEYEQLIYDSYHKPGSATPALQIQKIIQQIERTNASDKKIPPGLYAHLGMMYAHQGNKLLALAAFSEEKKRFPESAILIDGMIERSTKIVRQ